MTVHGDNRLIDVLYPVKQLGDQIAEFVWDCVPDGIRDIHRGGTFGDDRLHHFTQIVAVRACGIHGREFHVGRIGTGMPDSGACLFEHLVAGLVELVFQVNIGR